MAIHSALFFGADQRQPDTVSKADDVCNAAAYHHVGAHSVCIVTPRPRSILPSPAARTRSATLVNQVNPRPFNIHDRAVPVPAAQTSTADTPA